MVENVNACTSEDVSLGMNAMINAISLDECLHAAAALLTSDY